MSDPLGGISPLLKNIELPKTAPSSDSLQSILSGVTSLGTSGSLEQDGDTFSSDKPKSEADNAAKPKRPWWRFSNPFLLKGKSEKTVDESSDDAILKAIGV